MMRELKGVVLKQLLFEPTKRGDLLYFEGPVLSHFTDERGNDYFMNWVDAGKNFNRWLLTDVSKEHILKYLAGKMPWLKLITDNAIGAVYFLDIDKEAEYKHIILVSPKDIPDEYLPEKDSFFEMKYAGKYAQELVKETEGLIDSRKQAHSL